MADNGQGLQIAPPSSDSLAKYLKANRSQVEACWLAGGHQTAAARLPMRGLSSWALGMSLCTHHYPRARYHFAYGIKCRAVCQLLRA